MGLCRIKQVAFVVAALVTLLAGVILQPAQASMCACCVDPGEWYERSGKLNDDEFAIISNLKLYSVARLFSTDAFPYGFKGMSAADESNLTKDYGLKASQDGRRWTIEFKRKDGKRGTLSFTLPETVTRFGAHLDADLRKEPEDPRSIYKEVRFKGTIVGSGMFATGNAPRTTFLLVFQGYGNRCVSDSDYMNWTLSVSGPRASYRFYGAVIVPGR